MGSFEEVVRGRRSVRAFQREKPVPPATIRHALELAQHSPSNCNAQPWKIFVAAGERCERLRARLLQAAGSPGADATPKFSGVHRTRQIECAVELYRTLRVARHDAEGRRRAMLRNFEFFDAPHVAVLCMDQSFGVSVAVDAGCWLQTFLLALEDQGVSSCAQAALAAYPQALKEELEIPSELRVLCGVSFGFEDHRAAVNQTRQSRAPLSESVVGLGIDFSGSD